MIKNTICTMLSRLRIDKRAINIAQVKSPVGESCSIHPILTSSMAPRVLICGKGIFCAVTNLSAVFRQDSMGTKSLMSLRPSRTSLYVIRPVGTFLLRLIFFHASTSIHLIAKASWLNSVQVESMKTLWAFTGKTSPLRRLEPSMRTSLMGFPLQ